MVVSYTSSLTFSISGVAKEIMTLSLAVFFQNEHLSSINAVRPTLGGGLAGRLEHNDSSINIKID